MHILVVSSIITVLTYNATIVSGNLSISQHGKNNVNSTTYGLRCNISSHTTVASWEKEKVNLYQCVPPTDNCTEKSSSNYKFRYNAGSIYVEFNLLGVSEHNKTWTCKHGSDPIASFTVMVDLSSNADLCSWHWMMTLIVALNIMLIG